MADIYPPTVQRPSLLKLMQALDCWHRALRRDECGDWMLAGEHGHIYAVPDDEYQLIVGTPSARAWTYAKYKLDEIGARLQNDGDEEGTAFIRLPAPEHAKIIRQMIGLRQRRHLSDEQRELAARTLAPHRFAPQPVKGFAA